VSRRSEDMVWADDDVAKELERRYRNGEQGTS